ncbi:MAG: hypothetical protein RIC35_15150 [Marinoscillum sp.]
MKKIFVICLLSFTISCEEGQVEKLSTTLDSRYKKLEHFADHVSSSMFVNINNAESFEQNILGNIEYLARDQNHFNPDMVIDQFQQILNVPVEGSDGELRVATESFISSSDISKKGANELIYILDLAEKQDLEQIISLLDSQYDRVINDESISLHEKDILISANIGFREFVALYNEDPSFLEVYSDGRISSCLTGGLIGAAAGATVGGLVGAGIGLAFGGVGAIPGAVLGGFFYGAVGAIGGCIAGMGYSTTLPPNSPGGLNWDDLAPPISLYNGVYGGLNYISIGG